MKLSAQAVGVALLCLTTLSSLVYADSARYTREQLLTMPVSVLVDIVLRLQDRLDHSEDANSDLGRSTRCKTFQPLKDEAPMVMRQFKRDYSFDSGTIYWPNGKVFMQRNSVQPFDRALYYPNGQLIRENNQYKNTLNTIYWQNGQVLILRNQYETSNGSIKRPDGTAWVNRNNVDKSLDHIRYGKLVETLGDESSLLTVRLNDDESLDAKLVVADADQRITVTFSSASQGVFVEECVRF